MRIKSAVLALFSFCLALVPAASFADTLTLNSTGPASVDGESIYPYYFNVNGSSTLTSLMCLNMNRTITQGETWDVTPTSIGLDDSAASIAYRADALLYSQLGTQSASDVQLAVWDILDPMDASRSTGFTSNAQTMVNTAMSMAQDASMINSGFFSNFTLYVPTGDDSARYTAGVPQTFIGAAQPALAPEPSSLMLLGTGLVSVAGVVRRRLVRA